MSLLEERQPTVRTDNQLEDTQESAPITLEQSAIEDHETASHARSGVEYSAGGYGRNAGVRVDDQMPAKLAAVREALKHDGDEEVFTLTDLDTESVNTLSRAVEFFGPKVAEEQDLPREELEGLVEEVRAITRKANSLGSMRTETKVDPNDDSSEAIIKQSSAADLAAIGSLPEADATTESHLKFMASSLDHMRKEAPDLIEKKAANLVLEQLVEDPEKAVVVVEAVKPEKALRVKIAKFIGDRAVRRSAKKAVLIPKLSVRS